MRSTWHRALLVSFVLIMSSLAGCIGGDEDDSDEGKYGTVMVSTYHVGEIVKAITGDSVNIEMMSTSNIPVHDYEPSLSDIVRLSDADLFLYHGLGLEPWVEDALEGLGSDAPAYDMVHTMPTGEISLDFESMLVDQLCESLSNPSVEIIHMLAEDPEDAGELHGDDGAHNLGFPHDDHDEDHDDHDDGHDDHDEGHDDHDEDHDGHGDHDEHDHGEHTMLMPEDTLTTSSDCPAGTTISVYHMEAGEYMLEFQGEDIESFKMAIAKMMGAHHNHDHGDHGDEGHDDDHDDDHDDHGDDREDHDEHDDHDGHGDDRDEHDGHDGHDDHDEEFHADEMMPVWDTNNDSLLSWDEFVAGVESMEDEDHNACHNTLTHETTSDNETTCGAYSYYENYSMGGTTFTGCYNVMTHQTTSDNESACGAYTWMDPSDHGHDDEHDEMHHAMVLVYPDGTSVMIEAEHDMLPENASANDFTHMGLTESNISYDIVEDSTYGNYTNAIGGVAAPTDYSWYWQLHSWNESAESWESSSLGMDALMMEDAEHIAWAPNSIDDSMIPSPEDDHDGNDHDFEHEMEMAMFGYFFDEADADADMMLDLAEFESMAEALESQGDDMDMDIVVHIYMEIFDEDGNDALSLGEFTEMMEMMTEMGDDRDEHDEHDHGDHDEDEMVCYDISTHTIDQSYTNQADCESAGLMWTAANSGPGGDDDHDDDHGDDMNMTEMAEMMFDMFDANEDGSLSESELHAVFEGMGMDGHEEGVAFIALHIESEGEYGIALPDGVELHVLMRGGHDGHDHGSHDGHLEEDMCHNTETHENYESTEEECEDAGHMWAGDEHDDHGDEDDHDDHADEDNHDDHGEEELAYDPHSWLDPIAVAVQVDVVLENLIEAFPEGEDSFKDNADDFKAELAELDEKFASLADCTDRTVVANHNAYSYLGYRYDINFVTVSGLDPEGEPSPADILEVVEQIEDKELTVLFIEEYTSESSVESIVEQTGVEVKILYTMEMAPKDSEDNYLSLMEKNFVSLQEGMTCSA